uniref:Uncharacterized protein n=1 Tax=Caenorhabditis japonica TaxID=281687 RepID=A0A8R1E891_CAEJA
KDKFCNEDAKIAVSKRDGEKKFTLKK